MNLRLLLTSWIFAFVSLAAWAQQNPDDRHWDYQFGWPGGSNSFVTALYEEQGRIYIGSAALSGATNTFVEVWDGNDWSAIGNVWGSLAMPMDYLRFKGELYACGLFTGIDAAASPGVARWDGKVWREVTGGLKGGGYCMATDGNFLYVGGTFTNAGNVPALNVARFDGNNWSALGSGLGPYDSTGNRPVRRLLIKNGLLYAAGGFTNSGPVLTRGIASWNGTNWTEIGGGVTGNAIGMASEGNSLWVGGEITEFGGTPGTNLAMWNGASWTSHPVLSASSPVNGITVWSNEVFVTGQFTNIAGNPASRVARRSNNQWSALGAGLNDLGWDIRVVARGVLVGGLFNQADDRLTGHVALWNGMSWQSLGNPRFSQGANFFVQDLASDARYLYAGGLFTSIGSGSANRIARWDGTNWSALGKGVGPETRAFVPQVNAIAVAGTNVFVGGAFTNVGEGVNARNVAQWNGSTWKALGAGLNSNVWSMATDVAGNLYAGGDFTMAGGVPVNGVARWDGFQWFPLGTGISGSDVKAIAVDQTDVYVGGNFTNAGGVVVNGIARWDGAAWWPLGSGVRRSAGQNVSAIVIRDGYVYAGGNFTNAGGVAANRIARWKIANQTWEPLGTGIGGAGFAIVSKMAFSGADLYVSGNFTNAGVLAAQRIARWDGTNWYALGSGLSQAVGGSSASGLAVIGDDVFAGGTFEIAGRKPSYYVAHWNRMRSFDAPPTALLTSPVSGTTVSTGGNVMLFAAAGDLEGQIARVEFYAGTNLIGQATGAPFEVAWTPQVFGTVNIFARIYDVAENTRDSLPVSVLIAGRSTPAYLSIAREGNHLVINVTADTARPFILQASQTLTNWTSLVSTNGVSLQVREPIRSPAMIQFFRVREE